MSDFHKTAQDMAPFITPWVSSFQGYGLHARVSRSTNQSIGNNVLTVITYDTERRDIGGFWVVGNPTRVTVPVDGVYIFGAHVLFDAHATGVRGVYLRIDGVPLVAGDERNAGATAGRGTLISVATAINIAAASYVDVLVYQNSGAALNVLALTSYSNEFWITKIG